MKDQLDVLAEIEWDILVVLDAMRYDIWEDMIGKGEKVRSPANCTMEWIRAVLRNTDMRERLAETACITGNPEVTRWANEGLFASRDDLWERSWSYINGVGTVDPNNITKAVGSERVVGPTRPVYAHYVQPHGPYPKVDPAIPVMRNNPEADEVRTDVIEHPDHVVMDPTRLLEDENSWLDVEMLIEGYQANVEWVWEAIQPLLGRDTTVVVTADHGEILGEEVKLADGTTMRYGHPPGQAVDLLREVPLWVAD